MKTTLPTVSLGRYMNAVRSGYGSIMEQLVEKNGQEECKKTTEVISFSLWMLYRVWGSSFVDGIIGKNEYVDVYEGLHWSDFKWKSRSINVINQNYCLRFPKLPLKWKSLFAFGNISMDYGTVWFKNGIRGCSDFLLEKCSMEFHNVQYGRW